MQITQPRNNLPKYLFVAVHVVIALSMILPSSIQIVLAEELAAPGYIDKTGTRTGRWTFPHRVNDWYKYPSISNDLDNGINNYVLLHGANSQYSGSRGNLWFKLETKRWDEHNNVKLDMRRFDLWILWAPVLPALSFVVPTWLSPTLASAQHLVRVGPTPGEMTEARWVGSSSQPLTENTSPTGMRVNFQPGDLPIHTGYLPDYGDLFSDRGNGFSYGWNFDNRPNARLRDDIDSPDLVWDTFNHMQKGEIYEWEIALPNGAYHVRVVGGDPNHSDSVIQIVVEGVLVASGVPYPGENWIEGKAFISVRDGRLTITNGEGAENNKINFIEITPFGVASDGQTNYIVYLPMNIRP
jgi:hypothetical protein